MFLKQIKLTVFVVFGLVFLAQAQQTIPATGGDASGSGGSISYTIGQLVYTTSNGTNNSLAQGVQQVYEISTLGVDGFRDINLEYMVYPNPIVNDLVLKIKNYNQEDLAYQLYDIQGRIIKEGELESESTFISMQQFSSAIYFLRVINGQKPLKIFKIIKN